MKTIHRTALLSMLLAAGPPLASAQVDPGSVLCAPETPELDLHRTLRALSLDLRGVVPSVDEHEMVEATGEIPTELIDEWMQSEAFADRATRRHAALFWPTIDNVRLIHFRRRLRTTSGTMLNYLGQSATNSRGLRDVSCLDQPQSELQPGYVAGDPVTATVAGTAMDGTPIRQEGYALVRPYWDPTIEIKLCAFDAQANRYSSISGLDCKARGAVDDPAGIGHQHVDAGHLLVGEGDAAIDHEPAAAIAEQVHVHADLARPAERQEQKLVAVGWLRARVHQRLFR